MELFFSTLAFAAQVVALIVAAAAVVSFTYNGRSRRFLAAVTAVAYGAHLGFLALS